MLRLPANRILRALVIVSTVAVVICYAWLAAHLMEPQFTTPAYISETIVRAPDSHYFLFEKKFRQWPIESARIELELAELEPLLTWLGPLNHPIELLLDEKQSDRLLVTDSRIEIGRVVLLARGQLTKAVLKAWILQHASLAIASSQLRLEVASDVLMGMLAGQFSLEVPGFDKPLMFETTDKAWWTYADSYKGVCASAWTSLELEPLCENKNLKTEPLTVSELSFKEFLGSRIWRSYLATPLSGRLAFARRWVGSLQNVKSAPVPSLKAGWLAVVQGQLETLLPSVMDPLSFERAAWLAKVEAPLIVIDSAGHVEAPGTLKIASSELPIARARMAVMTVCESPSLRDVMSLEISVDRVVWKPECAERKTDFVQVRPSAIRIALNRGLARESDKLDQFVLTHRDVSSASKASPSARWLGLADAKYDEQVNAFQVHGAIEAVESYRLAKSAKALNSL
jgi:hypothetical protein